MSTRTVKNYTLTDLISDPTATKAMTTACIRKMWALQWDITRPQQLTAMMDSLDDIVSAVWLDCWNREALADMAPEEPITWTVIRSIRRWIRADRNHGISYDATITDGDGNEADRWSQQPAHNDTAMEAIIRVDLERLAQKAGELTNGHVTTLEAMTYYLERWDKGTNRADCYARATTAPKSYQVPLQAAMDEYIRS